MSSPSFGTRLRATNVEFLDVLAQRSPRHRHAGKVERARAATRDFTEDRVNPAGPGDVFDVVTARRADLAEIGRLLAERIDSLERKRHARLVRDRQDVQDRVGASTHRHVEDHGIIKRRGRCDLARQEAVARPALGEVLGHGHDPLGGPFVERLAIGRGRQNGAVAGQAPGRSPRPGSSCCWP